MRFCRMTTGFGFVGSVFVGLGCGTPGPDEDHIRDICREEAEGFALEFYRAECESNVRAIRTAQLSYDANYATYVEEASFHPDSEPGGTRREFGTGSAFDTIGWMPDGLVRGSYRVVSTSTTDFLVTCIIDADADGEQATYTATKTVGPTRTTPSDVY